MTWREIAAAADARHHAAVVLAAWHGQQALGEAAEHNARAALLAGAASAAYAAQAWGDGRLGDAARRMAGR